MKSTHASSSQNAGTNESAPHTSLLEFLPSAENELKQTPSAPLDPKSKVFGICCIDIAAP